jgi:hypothetical protein
MWVVVHMLSGMALGALLPNNMWVVVAAAVVGHLLLDIVPHWDYVHRPNKELWGMLDVGASAAIALVGYRYMGLPAKVVVCGIVSSVPDLDVLNALLPYKQRTRWFPSHWNSFPHGKAERLPGILIQVMILIVSGAVVIRYG